MTDTSEIIEFVRLRDAAAETPWSERHFYRLLVEPQYAHLDPRPKIRRLAAGNYNVLVRLEFEDFKRRLAAEGLKPTPKRTKLMQARHQARVARQKGEATVTS